MGARLIGMPPAEVRHALADDAPDRTPELPRALPGPTAAPASPWHGVVRRDTWLQAGLARAEAGRGARARGTPMGGGAVSAQGGVIAEASHRTGIEPRPYGNLLSSNHPHCPSPAGEVAEAA